MNKKKKKNDDDDKKKEKWRYLNIEKTVVISVVYKYFVKLGARFPRYWSVSTNFTNNT